MLERAKIENSFYITKFAYLDNSWIIRTHGFCIPLPAVDNEDRILLM